MAKISPFVFWQSLDNNGNPLAGGKVFTYDAGTSTPKTTFTSEDESAANPNPVILDASGRASIWLESGAYKFVIKDSNDVLIDDTDDITGEAANVFGSSVLSLAANTNITAIHQNNVIECTAALTLTLLDVGAANEGFVFSVKNSSAGQVIIDPDLVELVDGAATKTIEAGGSLIIVCTGTAWLTFAENYGDFIRDDSGKILVSINDTTAGDLETKLLVGNGLALSTQNDGANETRTIDALASTTAVAGVVEKATQAEIKAGTVGKFPDSLDLRAALGFSSFFQSTEQSITAGSLLTLAHGLAATPTEAFVRLVCKIAEQGYAIDDEIIMTSTPPDFDGTSLAVRGISVSVNNTNVYVTTGDIFGSFTLLNKTTGAASNLTLANWRIVAYARE